MRLSIRSRDENLNLKTIIREDRVKKIKSIREHVKENEEKIRSVDKRITINKDQVWPEPFEYTIFHLPTVDSVTDRIRVSDFVDIDSI